MFKYLWIVALVLILETVVLIPFKKNHLSHNGESIVYCVFFGNIIGLIIGTIVMFMCGIIIVSFCEFMGIVDYKEPVTNILDIGVALSSFIGYIIMLTSEWC